MDALRQDRLFSNGGRTVLIVESCLTEDLVHCCSVCKESQYLFQMLKLSC